MAASPRRAHGKLIRLVLAALGVVYGDIGTSPLYAINQIFFGHSGTELTRQNILGGISLVVWAITIVIAIKYLVYVLRADNDSEGGVFALYGLLNQYKGALTGALMLVLILAAGFLFGDGLITPAISVLSAVEGLRLATPLFENSIIPITILILTGLFAIQHKGTAKVGSIFGPIIMLWFLVITLLGARAIVTHWEILEAFNPLHGFIFLRDAGLYKSLLVLGSVMLVITGGEALYADMGHFGTKPIRMSWFTLVYPALILNYLGQGAYLLGGEPVIHENIFYSMVPAGVLYPMVLLATLATVIASQALISGAFSLCSQAIALGLFPRLKILHTHREQAGQIYISFINWVLYAGCVLLVIIFGSSSNLAAAYGLAVSGVMLATSLAMVAIARLRWNWSAAKTFLVFGIFIGIDAIFLTANFLKFMEGGFVPLGIGLLIFFMMLTWRWGRKTTFEAYSKQTTMTVAELVDRKKNLRHTLDRTIVFLGRRTIRSRGDKTPVLLQFFWDRYGVLPKNIILLDVISKKVPYIKGERYDINIFERDPGKGAIVGVTIKFGFMEDHNLERVLIELAGHHKIGLAEDAHRWQFLMSHERLFPVHTMGIVKRIKLHIYSMLRHISYPSYHYYQLGREVNLSLEIMPITID